jgi:hypothetical protein
MILKKKIKLSKKGFIISEALIIPLSLMIVGMMIYMASSVSIADEKTFEELTPELTYEFPKVVVYSFVNFPLSENDRLTIFGDDDFRTVSDLVWVNSDETKELINLYRSKFIESSELEFDKYLDLYKTFSGEEVLKKDLIKIISESTFFDELETELKDNNFFLRVPTNSGGDFLIYFKN